MAINTTTAYLASLVTGRFPITRSDAEITDWEFVNASDLSDDDLIDVLSDDLIDVLSDDGESGESPALLLSASSGEDRGAEDGEEFHAGASALAVAAIRSYGGVADYEDGQEFGAGASGLALVAIRSYGGVADHEEKMREEELEDPESEVDADHDDLDDELVPWSVGDRFGRQRMRKLGGRTYAKMNKTKKFAYTLNRPGCVRGKHGLGRKG
uniref:Uncharacterized protein n=1 Tax=Kalanchoe fedtschenkoi TaxID=63787 RepID=A0A7N0T1R3_KALFE